MFSKLNYNQQQEQRRQEQQQSMEEKKPTYLQPQPMKHQNVSRLQGEPLRGLTDLPNNGASSSNAMFARQDSLALAASFQQRDRERYPVDFMETELDLDNYLQCFTDLDVPADNIDFDDAELQKVNILYDEQPYSQPVMNGYERHVTYGPGFRKPGEYDQEEYKMNCEVKPETEPIENGATQGRRVSKRPAFDDYQPEFSEDSSDVSESASVDDSYYEPKSKRNKKTGLENFRPQTRARKYHLKADEEKAEPTYKLKRARNNDAVRKSRNKAKELQKKRDDEHDKMKRRIAELEGQLASEREARRQDKELIESLLRNKPIVEKIRASTRHPLERSANYNK
uniref:BZIP domain-containing protein n=1 Tax=Caenorhabditis tropicalis TaxID=1561998 RepID=A0A1I7T5L7_9PELO